MANHRWLRVGALASSLLLVGGFVSYRVGAFDRFLRPADPYDGIDTRIMGGSKSSGMFDEMDSPAALPDDNAADNEVMMFSTKSALVISDQDVTPTPPPSSPNDRVMQSGSKVMVLDFSPPPPPPTTNAQPLSKANGQPPSISNSKAE